MASILPEPSPLEAPGAFSYKDATQDDVMEDLTRQAHVAMTIRTTRLTTKKTSRFILNLPDHELASLERVCFQVEQAHWFYEDFIREQNPKFPSLPLKKFSAMFFQACPLLAHWSDDHEQAFSNFMSYKTKVPVCGAIMLNETWDKCVLVKGWKASSGWGFPKGKINEDEPPSSCAIREVLEETGYNLAGKVAPEDVIETTIQGQRISLFIVPNVPEDYPFKTKTRKEISKIEWFRLSELPTWRRGKSNAGRFYLITPFIGPLKRFINTRKPRKPQRRVQYDDEDPSASGLESDFYTEHSSMMSSASEIEESPAPVEATVLTDHDNTSMDPHFAQLLSGLAISATSKPLPPTNGLAMAGELKDSTAENMMYKATPRLPQKTDLPQLHAFSSQQYLHEDETPIAIQRNLFQAPPDFAEAQTSFATSKTPSASSTVPLPPHNEQSNHFAPPSNTMTSIPSPKATRLIPPPRAPSSTAGNLKHIAVLEHISKESARMMESFKLSQNPPMHGSGPSLDSRLLPGGSAPGPVYSSPRMASPATIAWRGMPTMNPVAFAPMNPGVVLSHTPAPPAAPYPIYPISPQMLGQNYNPANVLHHHPIAPDYKAPTAFTQITPYTGMQMAPAQSPILSRPFSAAAVPPQTNVFQLGTAANLHTPYPYAPNPTGPGENTLLSILNRPRHNSQIARPGP